ncbi:MAG TPA: tRNA (N6-isopentenyl adenosine(37)-C2)-methylthiotransferase MiaB [Pyrinomonadaceae bacterium]|jgi:tRNA-2-methylthio-N6-dimethylallyladenosine synthase|nr:tRNA (N6-isopentenyl adenosine(37)-C2)-methylthiotransferase MiaB [Pyrinomonadaceae bacterium]
MKSKVYIETFGCQMNVADTERAATGLRKAGYDLSTDPAGAAVVLLNTCSVRERAERKVFRRIGEIRGQARRAGQPKPLIGVMGCVAQLEGAAIFKNAPAVDLIIGTQATDRIPAMIERVLGGEASVIDLDDRQEGEVWDVSPAERRSPYAAFVPIIEGCNKFCSFCIVPYSRGREKSRSASEIVTEINRLRSLGYKEVHLIGQNVNSYRPKTQDGLERYSGATPFSRLLRAVGDTGMERIKFTTSFPRDFHPDIVSALEEFPNLCDWIHLPVQSGSDRILKAMRRGHTAADYRRRVEAIRQSRRRLSLTSDIIVGFPGESEEDFADTLRLVRDCEYDGLFIFKYSKRAGTPAALLENSVPEVEKKARFLELEELQESLQHKIYGDYVGRELSVLVERESTRSSDDMTGHSTCNKVVNFKAANTQPGAVVDVLISQAKPYSLYGELVSTAAN